MVTAGAAATVEGARAILNTTIDLITDHDCTLKATYRDDIVCISTNNSIQSRWQSS